MRRLTQRRAAAIITATLAVAGASTAALAGPQDDAVPAVDPSWVAAASTQRAPVAAVSDDVRSGLPALRDRAATGMPAEVAEVVGSSQRFGRNPALARAVDTVTGTGWVVPGDGFVCLVVPDPVDGYGTSCAPSAQVLRQGLSVQLFGALPNGRVAATVVLPDGAKAVRPDGSAVPAKDGVVSAFVTGVDDLRVVS